MVPGEPNWGATNLGQTSGFPSGSREVGRRVQRENKKQSLQRGLKAQRNPASGKAVKGLKTGVLFASLGYIQ